MAAEAVSLGNDLCRIERCSQDFCQRARQLV